MVVNKERGITTYDVIRKLEKKIGKDYKLGHTGTLDPIAEGVVVILVGSSNKLKFMFDNDKKLYYVEALVGYKSDTLDTDSKVYEDSFIPTLTKMEVKEVLKLFSGNEIEQIPPKYSAIKIKGKPAYYWTRKGVDIEKELQKRKRKAYIRNYFINYDEKERKISFYSLVSSGTYIRTLVDDIGKKLGTHAVMSRLIRLRSGFFKIKDSLNSQFIDKLAANEIFKHIIPVEDFFKNFTYLSIKKNDLSNVVHGVPLQTNKLFVSYNKHNISNKYFPLFCDNKLVAILEKVNDYYKYKRVLVGNI